MATTANDPFAFGDETGPAAAGQNQPAGPSPGEVAAAIQAEKRKRLAASIQRAAELIDSADILLLHTGAGWSADSGLPVYRDVASLPAMQQRSLTYRDICDPRWLDSNPQLFIGFWGHCMNQYRDTLPHPGYHILRRWRDDSFHERTAVAQRIEAEMERLRREKKKRRREKGTVWQDEENVVLQRDKGIVHPAEDDSKGTDHEQKEGQSEHVQVEAETEAEAERVHITSTFTLREEAEVRYSATVDSSTTQLTVAATDADGSGARAAESLSVTSETRAIQTPTNEPTIAPPASDSTAAMPPSSVSSSIDDAAPAQTPLPPGWVRGDDNFIRAARSRHAQAADEHDEDEDEDEQDERSPAAAAFFSLTSNVDAHFHRAGFDAHELYELHGNSETWQCSQLCSFDTWSPPPHFRFTIDPATLTAPYITPPPLSSIHISTDSDDDDDDTPTIVPSNHSSVSSTYWTPSSSFATNVPRCPLGHLARPNILMFNDSTWLRSTAAEQRYLQWMHAMLDVIEADSSINVVVLEVGCGTNVPTVRWRSESVWAMIRQRQKATVHDGGSRLGRRGLIRVNAWESRIDVEGKDEDCVSVELGGLPFVRIVDRLLEQQKRSRKRKADDHSSIDTSSAE